MGITNSLCSGSNNQTQQQQDKAIKYGQYWQAAQPPAPALAPPTRGTHSRVGHPALPADLKHAVVRGHKAMRRATRAALEALNLANLPPWMGKVGVQRHLAPGADILACGAAACLRLLLIPHHLGAPRTQEPLNACAVLHQPFRGQMLHALLLSLRQRV